MPEVLDGIEHQLHLLIYHENQVWQGQLVWNGAFSATTLCFPRPPCEFRGFAKDGAAERAVSVQWRAVHDDGPHDNPSTAKPVIIGTFLDYLLYTPTPAQVGYSPCDAPPPEP